jgi:hypothetical protein
MKILLPHQKITIQNNVKEVKIAKINNFLLPQNF